jgi:hypothetical protein
MQSVMHTFSTLFPVVFHVCKYDNHIVPDAMHSNCKGIGSVGIST